MLSHAGLKRIISRGFWNRILRTRSLPQTIENLRDPRPADAQKASLLRPAFELARIQKRLVVPSQAKRIAVGFRWFWLTDLGCRRGVPRVEFDSQRLT